MTHTATVPKQSSPSMSTEERGLAARTPASPAIITTPEQFNEKFRTWAQDKFNVLSPFTNFTGLQEGYGLIASRVSIDPDPDHGEVYGEKAPWVPKGSVALAKVGLRKIAECAGMSTTITRTDPYTVPNYWEVKAVARWRGIDGSIIEREAPFEWDMRDGSPRTKGFTANQVQEARKHGLRHCSTRAINAAIREYGVKQTYTREEMAKPFVVLRVVYMPDKSDPEVRRILAENALAGTSSLYAHPHAPALAPVIDALADDVDDAPRQAGTGATPAAAAATFPEGFGLIQKIEREVKHKRDRSGTFTKFHVVDYTGQEHVTIKEVVGEALEKCWRAGVAVDIESHENDYQELEIDEFHRADGAGQGSLLPSTDKL